MPRPPEHREQYMKSVERARQRFLARKPALEKLLEIAPHGDAFLEIFRWSAALPRWKRAWADAFREAPAPLSDVARAVVETLGDRFSRQLKWDDLARGLASDLGTVVPLEGFPDLPDVLSAKDRRAPVAMLAVLLARMASIEFEPQDLVLLEVAAGLAPPTGDPDEYRRRLDAAGDRLGRARGLAETVLKYVSPEANSGSRSG